MISGGGCPPLVCTAVVSAAYSRMPSPFPYLPPFVLRLLLAFGTGLLIAALL